MSLNFVTSLLERDDFAEILLKTSLASSIVYNDDPIKYLEQNYKSTDHEIESICFSQNHGDQLKYFNKLHEIKYLIINDKVKKRLYISFRGTQNISDILDDIKIYPVINDVTGRFQAS